MHEGADPQSKEFPLFVPKSRFTDDTVLTVAVASAVRIGIRYADALRQWGRRYPKAGYGGMFLAWVSRDDATPYHSFSSC